MRNFCTYISFFCLIFISCSISHNGFVLSERSDKQIDTLITSVGNLKKISNINCDGYFARISYRNGRYIDIFYPVQATDTIGFDFTVIIKNLKRNYPSNWPFYYAPLGIFEIDSILTDHKSILWNNRVTFLSLINKDKINWASVKFSGYEINYIYKLNLKGMLLSAPTQQINLYNSFDHIDDGPEQYPTTPYYQFIDSIPMQFLVPFEN